MLAITRHALMNCANVRGRGGGMMPVIRIALAGAVPLLLLLAALALFGGPGDSDASSHWIDYDTNDNNLIDVKTLDQLNAIRHDLDGDGDASHAEYIAAFPNRDNTAPGLMGCPDDCTGYELMNDLDFDTSGNDDVADTPYDKLSLSLIHI